MKEKLGSYEFLITKDYAEVRKGEELVVRINGKFDSIDEFLILLFDSNLFNRNEKKFENM